MTWYPIRMRDVEGYPSRRALTSPFPCLMYDGSTDLIPIDFEWDGSSTPTTPLMQFFVPRHGHPKDSCRHDYRCLRAKSVEERSWADKMFRDGIMNTPARSPASKAWLVTQAWVAYAGVSIGKWLGVGVRYPHWTDRFKKNP